MEERDANSVYPQVEPFYFRHFLFASLACHSQLSTSIIVINERITLLFAVDGMLCSEKDREKWLRVGADGFPAFSQRAGSREAYT